MFNPFQRVSRLGPRLPRGSGNAGKALGALRLAVMEESIIPDADPNSLPFTRGGWEPRHSHGSVPACFWLESGQKSLLQGPPIQQADVMQVMESGTQRRAARDGKGVAGQAEGGLALSHICFTVLSFGGGCL